MQKRMIALAAMAALTASMLMGSLSMAAEENTENIVDTAYGKVQGINHTGDYADVVEFRGIPYAAPPVGDLRWKPPVDPEPWEDVLVCDTYKDIPMQVLGGAEVEPYLSDLYYDGVPKMSEDCLYLNVMTTGDSMNADAKKPVFVWFHGGGLNSCYTFEPEGNGEAFAKNGIVFVSVEQRLGAFGYLSLPQLTEEQGQSGNYGLMDQIKAMQWIKENIANFGGDPENITVGGQSGGTTKAMSMEASPMMDVEVDRLILESGLKYTSPFATQEEAENQGVAYLQDLGLDGEISLEELRNMDAAELLDNTSASYPQSMNQDGLYVTYADIKDAVEAGVFDNVSILSGTNMGEGSYPQVTNAEDFYAAYKEQLGDLYDKYDFENLVKVTDISACDTSRELGTYGLGTNISRSLMVNRLFGKMMAERTGGNTKNYSYVFSQVTPESITDIGTDRSAASQWAWHTSEMWYAFDSMREGVPEVRQWRDWDYELAEKMNQYWSNFIKTGDPNGEGLAEWPVADENMGYIDFGAGIAVHNEELCELEQLMAEFTSNQFGLPWGEED